MIKHHKFVPSDDPVWKRGKRCAICHYPESDPVHEDEKQTTLDLM